MDYSKWDKLSDNPDVVDKGEKLVKKPDWAVYIEKKDNKRLKEMIDKGFDVKCTWTGERQRIQTPGNFADTNEVGTYTPLGMAVCWNNPEAVEMILAAGADPNQECIINKATRTPLSVAKGRNLTKIIKLLQK